MKKGYLDSTRGLSKGLYSQTPFISLYTGTYETTEHHLHHVVYRGRFHRLTWVLCQSSWCTGIQCGYLEYGTWVTWCSHEVQHLMSAHDTIAGYYRFASMQKWHSQSGLVWSSVVGEPTAVRQALHHLDLKSYNIFIRDVKAGVELRLNSGINNLAYELQMYKHISNVRKLNQRIEPFHFDSCCKVNMNYNIVVWWVRICKEREW